ncbi:unnamed protein product [Rotaria socialis]|uniref:Eukaryotic translation initiation factor 5B n=1 Tax=Rotaria socialis TaxID=392032 RepID=A0A820E4U7_9BILA|nr:unnamed protein product [Rotaria socialis]
MSKEQAKQSVSKATDVATDINIDDDQENNIRSQFIIVSDNSNSKIETHNNDEPVIISNEISLISSITENENNDKKPNKKIPQSQSVSETAVIMNSNETHTDKLSIVGNKKSTSSSQPNKKKHGPSAKMLKLIMEAQEVRKAAEKRTEEKAKEKQRLEEERERLEQEKLRSERENQEKMKHTENKTAQLRHKAVNPTRKQRDKLQLAQIQSETAGVQTLAHEVSPPTISNNGESVKKKIIYANQPTKTKILSNTSTQSDAVLIESQDKPLVVEQNDRSTDEWEQNCDNTNISYENRSSLATSRENNNDHQLQSNTDLAMQSHSSEIKPIDKTENEIDQSLSVLERLRRRLEHHHELCENQRSTEVLRAPVICVLGHVDAGKTTILDNLRQTHVQENEAGGITQQIGATNVSSETIYRRTEMCREMISREGDFIVPGLLIIDTPGHEIFKSLRSRGSSLCDLAILVVDIMHGVAPQTIESIHLLLERQTPFIIALNKQYLGGMTSYESIYCLNSKVDLLYDWKSNNKKSIELVLQEQQQITQNHFEKCYKTIICQFAEQNLNVALYYENPDPNEYYSMVPTSARSGDGMGSLIALIIEKSQTTLSRRISYTNELQATVMEVKAIDGFGMTIDIALVNGCLSVGDKIVIAGQEGPIVTQIRRLLIPASNQELRTTNQYQNEDTIKGARGIKIVARGLEKAMAGLPLFVARQTDETDFYKNEIGIILKTALNSIQLEDKGVYVQASTLGSLEGLLQLLKTSNIPYSGINIGPVHRIDVMRASAQLEKDVLMATILAFDVQIEKEAQEYANKIGVKIFQNDEIYRLCDMFLAYRKNKKNDDKENFRHLAVFPCKLKILPQYIFNARDPIICGVLVEDGFITNGTPICVPSNNGINLGRIDGIQKNGKPLDIARKGSEVCIKIVSMPGEAPKAYGRHFDKDDILMSKVSRESIDILKAYFREEMQEKDWKLIIELKKIFGII